MKLKTQSRLLICGILAVPLLLIALQLIYRHFENESIAAAYQDIAEAIDDTMSTQDREFFSHLVYRLSKTNNITVFRRDFFVVYSSIPGFNVDETASMEKILRFVGQEGNPRYVYTFEAPLWMGNNGYILVERDTSQPRKPRLNIPIGPLILPIALFLFPIVFAITMSLIIARSITKSVLVLEDATRRIAEGELDLTVNVKGSNEITSLTNSLNKMRKELKEEELRRSRFIMGISHDLKTPLALIKGYAEAIEDGVAEGSVARNEAAGIIAAKSDQLEGMINDLIDFVRMDTGEWQGRLKKINLGLFLRDFAGGMAGGVELLNHTMTTDIALGDDCFVPMDERLVQRALENLVGNAIRYTPNGSHIRLEAVRADDAVKLMVCDNGPGIAEADLPHIFEMFYRGSTSRREQGMGLGLAVVKWVIDSHGWNIAASSPPDGGSGSGVCFSIRIPLVQ